MTERLDTLMARLAEAPADHALDHMEADVAGGIARWREDAGARSSLGPVRVASVGLALAMGVIAGGAAATSAVSEPRHFDTFAIQAALAPSTLLDGG
jgi:hypothetical protein